jgi:hypothetical protein
MKKLRCISSRFNLFKTDRKNSPDHNADWKETIRGAQCAEVVESARTKRNGKRMRGSSPAARIRRRRRKKKTNGQKTRKREKEELEKGRKEGNL